MSATFDVSAPRRAGLFVDTDLDRGEQSPTGIPLTSVRAQVRIAGTAAHVTLRQTYQNRERVPIEAIYIFPLDEASAVCGFAVTSEGRRLEAEIRSREDAFDVYDDAMAEGHAAFLLDQERSNVLTASIGNLRPDEKVEVELRYVTELGREGVALRFVLPGYVAPRYVPASRRNFEGLDDAERISPPALDGPSPYTLDLEIEADLHSPLARVESPSHALRTEMNGSGARIRLAGPAPALDRDFVLLLEPKDPVRPLAGQVQDEQGQRFAAATFLPAFEAKRGPVHVEFVVDCSGSMAGESIAEVRRTLRLCLRSLKPGDRFNLIRFGSSHVALFPEARLYDEASFRCADAYVEKMEADLGGTEVVGALRAALAPCRENEGMPRRIVVLTDGLVSNEAEVFALARLHRHAARIFAFGIGSASSGSLVRGLARASGGEAEMVYPGEGIEAKVARQFRRLVLPCLEQVSVRWEGLEVEDVTPAEVPLLVPGEPLTVMARVVSGFEGRAVLSAVLEGEPIRFEAEIPSPGGALGADVLPLVWARRRIRDLEDSLCAGEVEAGHSARDERGQPRREQVRGVIRDLACRHGLLSSETSFVVVDEREEAQRTTSRPQLRRVGVYCPPHLRPNKMDVAPHSLMAPCVERFTPLDGFCSHSDVHYSRLQAFSLTRTRTRDQEPERVALLLLQSHEGCWTVSPEITKLMGLSIDALEQWARSAGRDEAGAILMTWLVLRELRKSTFREDSFEAAMVDKAQQWIDAVTKSVPPPAGHADWGSWLAGVGDPRMVPRSL